MNDNEFWIKVWKCVAVVICVLIMSVTASCQTTKFVVLEMAKKGANPVDAACSLAVTSSTVSSNPVCIVRSVSKK